MKSETDTAVLETVQVDLATATDKDSISVRQEQHLHPEFADTGQVLFVSQTTRTGLGWMGQTFRDAEPKWRQLDPKLHASAIEAAAVAKWRVKELDLHAPFRSSDPRLLVWEDRPESKDPDRLRKRDGPRPVYLVAPGYNEKNDVAVVNVCFTWSKHGGEIVYLLEHDGTRRTVSHRVFFFFC